MIVKTKATVFASTHYFECPYCYSKFMAERTTKKSEYDIQITIVHDGSDNLNRTTTYVTVCPICDSYIEEVHK